MVQTTATTTKVFPNKTQKMKRIINKQKLIISNLWKYVNIYGMGCMLPPHAPPYPPGNSQSVDHMDLLLVSGNNGKGKYLKIIQT